MNSTFNWHKLSRYLTIKTALPHLLLGVIAAGFSCSDKSLLSVQISTTSVSVISISIVSAELQVTHQTQSQTVLNSENNFNNIFIKPIYTNISLQKNVRLTSYNGIRAGPFAAV